MSWTALKLRWRALLHRREFERDIADEIEFHRSMSPRLGNATRIAEDLRELRGFGLAERLWQDLRYAARQIRRNPGFACAAIVPLALAVGCIGSVLTLADAVLFRPLGVKDPNRIAAIYTFSRAQNHYLSESYPDFRDISALPNLMEASAAYLRSAFNVRLGDGAELMNTEMVTGDYFHAAGVSPILGRPFTPEDDRPGAASVALASYSLWQNRFQGSSSILGSVVWINHVPFTIVGVMPRGYQGMLLDWYPDCSLWVPLVNFNRFFPTNTVPGYTNRRDIPMFMMLARLRPGVTVGELQAALDGLAPRVVSRPDYRFIALPSGQARFFPAYRDGTLRFLWMLLAVSAAAVAIACFNLAGLLLARAASRRHEVAARLAIGASRFRIVQQFLVENALIALYACALSLPIALAAAYWLRDAPITRGFSMSLNLSADWRALALGMLAGFMTAMLAGTSPAFEASRSDITVALKPRHSRGLTSRDLFIGAQVACAMTILLPAALMAQNLRDLGRARLGFDTRDVLLAAFDPFPGVRRTTAEFDRLTNGLLTDLRTQAPGAALAGEALPTTMFSRLDTSSGTAAWTPLSYDWISDGYFELLHEPILSGRAILPSDDRRAQPVVVVNQSAAEMLWPGRNPVGQRLRIRNEPTEREVVGVVADSRFRPLGVSAAAEPCLFLPLAQRANPIGFEIHVRTAGPPLQFANALRKIAARVDPDGSLSGIRTLQEQSETGLKPMQMAAQATGAVSLLGILLAVAGMFAASAFRITQKKKEIAIRIAIGAEPGRVIRAFAARGLWIGLAGACLGIMPAAWGARLVRASITGAGVPGVGLFVLVGLILVLASVIAAFAAARRITRVQPSDVLRVQ